MARKLTPTQALTLRRLQHGLPPIAEQAEPVAPRPVQTHDYCMEGSCVCFWRFFVGVLCPELWRVYDDGRAFQA